MRSDNLPEIIDKQRRRVQAFVARGEMSKHALARAAKLPPTTLTGLERKDWNPLPKTLTALIRVIQEIEGRGKKKSRRQSATCVAA